MIRKILFVDGPQLIVGNERLEFAQLASNLSKEFDEIKTYLPFRGSTHDVPSIFRSLSYVGIYPTLVPVDPDPIIAAEIIKIAYREGNRVFIGLLSGDNGYYNALLEAKKAGAKIKIILPNGNHSKLLTSIADEVTKATDYAPKFFARPQVITEKKALVEKPTIAMKKSIHVRVGGT